MSSVIDSIYAVGIMPVATKIDGMDTVDHLAKALLAGGIPQLEITFRMPHAEDYIRYARETYPQLVVGAGTVTLLEQAEKALDAGAQFVVAPGLNPEIVRYCRSRGTDVIPGVATATEVEQALGLGLDVVKFFPAEQMGGIATINSLSGPYKGVRFMPTGGIGLENLSAYLANTHILAVGGTFMIRNYLADGAWDEITRLCKRCVQTMLGLKLAHVGVNEPDEAAAQESAHKLGDLLFLSPGKEGSSSVFVDQYVEVMKSKFLGANGHIGFSTPNLDRSVAYFRARGIRFREDSAKYAPDGRLNAIYFADEIGGFAIHLLRQ